MLESNENMKNDFYFVIAFENTHSAMMAQKLLRPVYKFQVIPTLREITQSCGISVMLEDISESEAKAAATSLNFDSNLFKLYKVQPIDSKKTITPIEI